MPRRTPTNALAFKRRLLRWFRQEGRDLPWRETRDPYRVLVSEIMLQQTQVARVQAFYPSFLAAYPTLTALAQAPWSGVREHWEGLGYYRRAANLHRLAQIVRDEHQGQIPAEPSALRRLPGIGRYTAGAVASFAFERRVPAIDTNALRVLQRVFHPRGTRAGPSKLARKIEHLAIHLLPRRRSTAWEFNQALMDLGALVCRARRPLCSTCPVRPACRTGRSARRRSGGQPH